MSLTTTAFLDGQPIPRKHTGDGADISPPLEWKNVPANAKSLALICDDPDAPTPEPWVHWVIYNITVTTEKLPEAVSKSEQLALPAGALQGKNNWNTIGYRGPAPPRGHGFHHYHFRLYALDAPAASKHGLTKNELLAAMRGHILEQCELVGTYQR
jgi:Raf kinase inhibitor-like YbhB/YbcL family protein